MSNITIAIIQIVSPFILIGLLLLWIYRISENLKRNTKNMENIRDDHESVYRRLSAMDDRYHSRICNVEDHIEEMDDVIVGILHDAEDVLRANKTKPKAK